jgi:hypothetical protein
MVGELGEAEDHAVADRKAAAHAPIHFELELTVHAHQHRVVLADQERGADDRQEQHAQAALDIADHGYILENGRVVLEGTAAELRANEDIQEFYLGKQASGERRNYRDVKHYRRRKRWLG